MNSGHDPSASKPHPRQGRTCSSGSGPSAGFRSHDRVERREGPLSEHLQSSVLAYRSGLSRPFCHGGTCSGQPMEVPTLRAIHRDPRPGAVAGSSRYSNKLLSVQDVGVRHHMQHARQRRWQSPITDALLLSGRLPHGDPRTSRARAVGGPSSKPVPPATLALACSRPC